MNIQKGSLPQDPFHFLGQRLTQSLVTPGIEMDRIERAGTGNRFDQ